MKIYDLRTEYRENLAGLAAAAPRFSWKMKTDEKIRYRICIELR